MVYASSIDFSCLFEVFARQLQLEIDRIPSDGRKGLGGASDFKLSPQLDPSARSFVGVGGYRGASAPATSFAATTLQVSNPMSHPRAGGGGRAGGSVGGGGSVVGGGSGGRVSPSHAQQGGALGRWESLRKSAADDS